MKILTIHNGCETNLYDSESGKRKLLSLGGKPALDRFDADLIVFHACTFTQQKEEETKSKILQLLELGDKKIIVSGCFQKDYIVDSRIIYLKNIALSAFFEGLRFSSDDIHSHQEDHDLLPFVQISKGCYGSCTFCSIRNVKGSHKSRPLQDILNDISHRKSGGTVKLVGDEVAGYGRDIGSNLSLLLKEIIANFPNLKIKLGSLNAKLLKLYSDDELKSFAHENIAGNIHIPIQSASNEILSKMRRGYTIEEYLKVYSKLKSMGVPRISGDLICGFPGETVVDHQKNIAFITENAFMFLEVFVYQERENTIASCMEQLEIGTREKRAVEVILKFLKSYSDKAGIPIETILKQPRIFNTNLDFRNYEHK